MTTGLASYLGRDITELLRAEPFIAWKPVRSIETESKHEVWYEFDGHGIEVICDLSNRIQSIFVHPGDAAFLIDVSFSMGRQQVLERFGIPDGSGSPVQIPGLGHKGAWDRFVVPEGVLHVEYSTERDEINMVTLMRADVVP